MASLISLKAGFTNRFTVCKKKDSSKTKVFGLSINKCYIMTCR